MAFVFLFMTLILVYILVRGSLTTDTRYDNTVLLVFSVLITAAFVLRVL